MAPLQGTVAAPSFDLGRRAPGTATAAPGAAPGTASGLDADGGLKPRQWQRQLINLMRRRLERAGAQGEDVLVHAGPGAGKTLGALLGFQRLVAEGRLSHFLVFCHRQSIASQWRSAAARLGLELRDLDLEASAAGEGAGGDPGANEGSGEGSGGGGWSRMVPGQGLLISYQSAARHRRRLERELAGLQACKVLAIADEVHHLGLDPDDPEATAWSHAFGCLSRGCVLRLGLSGTPFRADNLGFSASRRISRRQEGVIVEEIAPDLSVEPRQLIDQGDVRPLEFRFQNGWIDHGLASTDGSLAAVELERSPLSAEHRESWRARNLRRAIRLGDPSSIALRVLLQARLKLEALRAADHPEAGGLVIARDIAHARGLTGLLEEQGDQVLLVHSQDPEAAQRLATFRAGGADWLVSIDMCAEGFDAPRLRVVAYLTTVVTRSRFVQAITRAVRIDGQRAEQETIPRHPSYVYAPADPLLVSYARTWSVAEPYLIQPKPGLEEPAAAAGGRAPGLPLEALHDEAGEVIRLRGPQLPGFLHARQRA
ncbi:DEAD/DEAH box helicase family protein [Synechococcus sp. ATX 2A4]|nr:DEAD/DEAH box helicase family protein [Synechococcus sp. ATX 2A4]